ncbi:hypothetical protein ACEN9J_07715 [Variovorax sp. Varisp41]|uniref:hypothetical protein n=1 Tax=Variovorax sp. Varisp41 TaxID=3243033 RepID=UPI0039B59735
MIKTVFGNAMKNACTVLQDTQGDLRKLKCPPPSAVLTLRLQNLGGAAERTLLNALPTGNRKEDINTDHVYVIGLTAPTAQKFSILRSAFSTARDGNTDPDNKVAFCRRIDTHKKPSVIYVGRSKKLRARIAQHLDDKSGRTYAMHMGRWAKALDLELAISYITFTDKTDSLVQAVEDGLWMALKPALGKHGAR